ncbi:nucleotidyltransferase family protein [Roseobacteraceae bacterium S113]
MIDAALLFAAGFGTRMAPLTDHMPKPLIKVDGTALLDHALALCTALNLPRIVVNTHYRAAQIEDHLKDRNIALSHEAPDVLETGGGLRHALPLLGPGPVFTLNTDAVWSGPNPLSALRAAWDPARMDALLLCVPLAQTTGHSGTGDFTIAQDGQLTRGGTLVYSGAQIINPASLHDITERAFSLNLPWNEMATRGRLFGLSYTGRWADVGRPDAIKPAEDMLRNV